MITALIQIKLPTPVTLEKATELFSGSAQNYRNLAGLIRKYYILSEDGGIAGGVYLWESREEAENFFNAGWRNGIKEKYGNEPLVAYFSSPVIVDNLEESIIIND